MAVKVPKEVAEVLDRLRVNRSNYDIISGLREVASSDFRVLRNHFGKSNEKRNPDILVHILVEGYEIEPAPNEQLTEKYEAAMELTEQLQHENEQMRMEIESWKEKGRKFVESITLAQTIIEGLKGDGDCEAEKDSQIR
jgi:hypothetical protein